MAFHDAGGAATLADKRRFAPWCVKHGFPTVPILLEFEEGRVTRGVDDGRTLPPADVFAKWAARFGGRDARRWRYQDGQYIDGDGRSWSASELIADLIEQSRQGPVILQPRVVNHAALRGLAPSALSTVRVMTCRRPGGAAALITAVYRLGIGNATADNRAQGGIAGTIDPHTGAFGRAVKLDDRFRPLTFDAHPDTGAPITGFRLPFWEDVTRLPIEAHALLPDVPCIGWDVAVLDEGPVLLEGNWNPSPLIAQIPTGVPLFETEYRECMAAWLDARVGTISDARLLEYDRWYPV